MKLKRIALLTLIASVGLSAALGVYALLVGDFGEFEAKILFTSLAVSAASILAMSCAVAWERRLLGVLPQVGAALALLGCGGCVLGVWAEFDYDPGWQTVLTATFFAIGAAHVCLLSLARLEARFRWAYLLGVTCALLLSIQLSVLVWAELFDEEWSWRSIGIVAILLAASTIAVPLFHRISALPLEEPTGDAPRVRACPACGADLDEPPGEVHCSSCGGRFKIELLDRPAASARTSTDAENAGGARPSAIS